MQCRVTREELAVGVRKASIRHLTTKIPKNPIANQRLRFSQKTRSGERRCDANSVSAKIFSLPKFATQSPRNALSTSSMSRGANKNRSRIKLSNNENICGTVAFAILTIGDAAFAQTIRIAWLTYRRVVAERASCVASYTRQHFLKRDAVFLDVLVYSGCSAFRFPSARSD